MELSRVKRHAGRARPVGAEPSRSVYRHDASVTSTPPADKSPKNTRGTRALRARRRGESNVRAVWRAATREAAVLIAASPPANPSRRTSTARSGSMTRHPTVWVTPAMANPAHRIAASPHPTSPRDLNGRDEIPALLTRPVRSSAGAAEAMAKRPHPSTPAIPRRMSIRTGESKVVGTTVQTSRLEETSPQTDTTRAAAGRWRSIATAAPSESTPTVAAARATIGELDAKANGATVTDHA